MEQIKPPLFEASMSRPEAAGKTETGRPPGSEVSQTLLIGGLPGRQSHGDAIPGMRTLELLTLVMPSSRELRSLPQKMVVGFAISFPSAGSVPAA